MAIETPFNIGDKYWVASLGSTQEKMICPICCGKLFVKLTLGDGSELMVQCQTCERTTQDCLYSGMSAGFIYEYVYDPKPIEFIIAGISSFRDGKWNLISTIGNSCDFEHLFKTYEEAFNKSKENTEQNITTTMMGRQRAKTDARGFKSYTWNAQYHTKEIKEAQRKIEWHSKKIQEHKAGSK